MSDPLSSGRWDIEVSESRKDIPNDDNPLDSQSTKQFTKIIVDRDGNEIERLRPSKSDSAAIKKPIESTAIVSSAPVKTLLPASSSVGSQLNKPKYRPSPPINPFSAILFTWLSPLLQLGSKRPLMEEDLFNPYTADKSDRVYQDFLVAYEAERQRQIQIAKSGSDSAPPSPRLWRVFWTQYKREILVANIIYGFVNADQLLAPYFLNRLVDFAQSRNSSGDSDSDWLGYRWAVCLFCSAIVSSFARAKSIEMLTRVAVRIRNILTLAIFNKALTISSARKSDGAIQSLMSVGPQQVVELASSFPNLYSAPLLIALGVWQMSLYVGWAAVVGLAFMMLTLVPVGLMTAKQMALMKVYLGKSDHRIKLINEALQSIKVVKLYNWQRAFLGIITEARNEELRTMWDYAKVRGIVFGFLLLTPIMTAIIIFLTYSGTGGEMTASRVFTTLSLIAVIRFPFTFLPMALTGLTNMLVTFARTEQFLEKPDIIDRRTRVDRVGIELQEAEFTWTEDGSPEQQKEEEEKKDGKGKAKAKAAQDDKKSSEPAAASSEDGGAGGPAEPSAALTAAPTAEPPAPKKPILRGLNLVIPPGELLAVVGAVAAGKSSLLMGLLGECYLKSGRCSVGGQLSYIPQSAFIINASFRDNILFGARYDAAKYQRTIAACCLEADFATFPAGDQTEVGERGISISGGQKQRCAMARAVYNLESADVFLFDDPLSAVDHFVAHRLFDQVIGPNGILKHKTRILVTHALQFAERADRVCVLREDREEKDVYTIGAVCTYRELLKTDQGFIDMMASFNRGQDEVKGEQENGPEDPLAVPALARGESSGTHSSVPRKVSEAESPKLKPAEAPSAEALEKGKLVDKEERESGEVSLDVYKSYFRACGPLVALLSALLVGYVGSQVVQYLSDFWLSIWSDDVDKANEKFSAMSYLGIYALIGAVYSIFMVTRSLSTSYLGWRASRALHAGLLENVFYKTMTWNDRTPVGRILNRFSKDQNQIDSLIPFIMEWAISNWTGTIGTLILCGTIVPILFAIIAPLLLVVLHFGLLYHKSSVELQRLDSLTRTPIYVHFAEMLQGVCSIRALKLQSFYLTSSEERIDGNTRPQLLFRLAGVWVRLRLEAVGALILASATVLGVASELNGGLFGFLILYALQTAQMINWALILLTMVQAQMNSVERVHHYSQPIDLEPVKAQDEALSSQLLADPKWPQQGRVEFVDVEMRYRPDLDPVLRGVSVVFEGGKKIGIVGRTGSGKSSMLVALFRLVELSGGKILIDGVDHRQIGLDLLRSRLSILPQEPVLFSGSIRYNLDPFNVCTDEELWDALEVVQMKGYVERMDKQLQASVAENGASLSVGQRQLLCFARALLRRSNILCLDEATSATDPVSDEVIQGVIRSKFSHCTVISIAHRLNTIIDYDRILVLKDGRVAEYDDPQVLRANPNSIFADMLRAGNDPNKEKQKQSRDRKTSKH